MVNVMGLMVECGVQDTTQLAVDFFTSIVSDKFQAGSKVAETVLHKEHTKVDFSISWRRVNITALICLR